MSDRRRLLLRSSEHISQLIQLALLHEENIQQEYNIRERDNRHNRISRINNRDYGNNDNMEFQTFEIDITNILDRIIDPSYNRRNSTFDISSINHLLTYNTYNNIVNPINTSCPITHDEFVNTDEIIMINQCRHIFKKNSLLNWLQRRQTCPCCRITLV